MLTLRAFLFAAAVLLLAVHPARAAESLTADPVRVEWVAPERFSSSEPAYVGIRFRLDPEWHIYWKNPGDSGAAPKFQLSSEHASLGEVLWPFPSRIPFGDLVNLGYEGEVVFPIEVKPIGSPVRIEAKLEWLVCKEECVPGFGTLTLARPAQTSGTRWKKGDQERISRALGKIPSVSSSPWEIVQSERVEEGMKVRFERKGEFRMESSIDFFPTDRSRLQPSKPRISETSKGFEAVFKPTAGGSGEDTGGIVVIEGERSWLLESKEIGSKKLESTTTAESSPFWFLLLSAFLGGVMLNLMPCVFPVLSIKVASLVTANHERSRQLREGSLYTLGVIVTFALLGGAFLALRAAGNSVGWGFQLQVPAVVLLLALLFWLMALNFLGVFEMGIRLMNWTGRSTSASSFATGVLSVFVAAPCTGPFMGTALGAAATLPVPHAMGIFLGLGLGLASPFLALTAFPRFLAWLPRPGKWMETFKQFLAFPLFATVLWLLWVLGQQTGSDGWVVAATLLLVVSFAIWLSQRRAAAMKVMASILVAVALVTSIHAIRGGPFSGIQAREMKGAWAAYDQETIAAARKEGRPVFVDFTAAWCITCQWNKKSVLDTSRGQQLFRRKNVALFRADWTNHDPRISEALAEFGRSSIPVYLYYAPGAESPRSLPQMLTFSIIEEVLNDHPKKGAQ